MANLEIEVYADEIITPLTFNNKRKNILGICVLFVPVKDRFKLVNDLKNMRCLHSLNENWYWDIEQCPYKDTCKRHWHDSNNTEIHHEDIRISRASFSEKEISKKWLKYLINLNKNDKAIYFNILYIDLDKLKIDSFGKDKNHENIYNKFFRTAINYGVESFFSEYHKVIIHKVYHDTGNMEHHKYFPFLNLNKLNLEINKDISIINPQISFVNSDHRKYENDCLELKDASQVIQFVDLILGSISQNIYYLSDDALKKEVAMIIRPLTKRLIKEPSNIYNEYKYFKKQKISVYPKYIIEESKWLVKNLDGEMITEHKKDQFHTEIDLDMPAFDINQQSLKIFFQ